MCFMFTHESVRARHPLYVLVQTLDWLSFGRANVPYPPVPKCLNASGHGASLMAQCFGGKSDTIMAILAISAE